MTQLAAQGESSLYHLALLSEVPTVRPVPGKNTSRDCSHCGGHMTYQNVTKYLQNVSENAHEFVSCSRLIIQCIHSYINVFTTPPITNNWKTKQI